MLKKLKVRSLTESRVHVKNLGKVYKIFGMKINRDKRKGKVYLSKK